MKYIRGVTLIETIIYLALFAIIIVGLVLAAYGLLENVGRTQSRAMMQEEEMYVLAKIQGVLGRAETVTLPAAETSGKTLTLRTYNSESVSVNESGNAVLFNGVVLNNTNVTIHNLVFIHTYRGGSEPESIEAGFTITTKAPNGSSVSETASTTRYIHR